MATMGIRLAGIYFMLSIQLFRTLQNIHARMDIFLLSSKSIFLFYEIICTLFIVSRCNKQDIYYKDIIKGYCKMNVYSVTLFPILTELLIDRLVIP